MLRSRLLFGTILAGGIGAILVVDPYLAPVYPLLFVVSVIAGVLGPAEFWNLLPEPVRPDRFWLTLGTVAILASNWLGPVLQALGQPVPVDSGWVLALAVALGVVGAFLRSLARYTAPGEVVARLGGLALGLVYLGLLPSFFLQIRWLGEPRFTSWLLVVAVFVPKVCDIGAYTVGRLLGRTPFAPRLSPKKTYEGFIGGLLAAIGTAVGAHAVWPIFTHGVAEAVAFGLVIGTLGVWGDLAESLLKRETGTKDASRTVPGFGGILDILDSVLFVGPVVWLWLRLTTAG